MTNAFSLMRRRLSDKKSNFKIKRPQSVKTDKPSGGFWFGGVLTETCTIPNVFPKKTSMQPVFAVSKTTKTPKRDPSGTPQSAIYDRLGFLGGLKIPQKSKIKKNPPQLTTFCVSEQIVKKRKCLCGTECQRGFWGF